MPEKSGHHHAHCQQRPRAGLNELVMSLEGSSSAVTSKCPWQSGSSRREVPCRSEMSQPARLRCRARCVSMGQGFLPSRQFTTENGLHVTSPAFCQPHSAARSRHASAQYTPPPRHILRNMPHTRLPSPAFCLSVNVSPVCFSVLFPSPAFSFHYFCYIIFSRLTCSSAACLFFIFFFLFQFACLFLFLFHMPDAFWMMPFSSTDRSTVIKLEYPLSINELRASPLHRDRVYYAGQASSPEAT